MGASCKVGNDYNDDNEVVSNIEGKWFFNTAVPATCSGSFDEYKVRYYDSGLDNANYDLTLAIWTPVGGTYIKVKNILLC